MGPEADPAGSPAGVECGLPVGVSGGAFPAPRLAPWLRRPRPSGAGGLETASSLASLRLNTVCREARCPNRDECWDNHTAAFLMLGIVCTRNCRFCAVASGKPSVPDPEEPSRIADAVKRMSLSHAVITSVTRDDLADGGAGQFADCIREVRTRNPGVTVEVLTPDFQGSRKSIQTVLEGAPQVFNHNLETVERLSPLLRPQGGYHRSLEVLSMASESPGIMVKSGLMLGLGETDAEIRSSLAGLRSSGVTLLTIGQYLQPSPAQLPVARFVPPAEFNGWKEEAMHMGFRGVASSPFTRSSHMAGKMLDEALHAGG